MQNFIVLVIRCSSLDTYAQALSSDAVASILSVRCLAVCFPPVPREQLSRLPANEKTTSRTYKEAPTDFFLTPTRQNTLYFFLFLNTYIIPGPPSSDSTEMPPKHSASVSAAAANPTIFSWNRLEMQARSFYNVLDPLIWDSVSLDIWEVDSRRIEEDMKQLNDANEREKADGIMNTMGVLIRALVEVKTQFELLKKQRQELIELGIFVG
ncbi:hypothetical protein K491DRAFT_759172 [Lophiostoma macrostomum CBS 122681]|uniref:Uncharacterized protein n=1 Tax=Lophiostoma macrostomum CBS 122681 TaxID=1314788 RepID=A0A6A6T2L1_9PLEO|nr:hypothetical protein K491DRAFT_759172 [Lophiostoma macrostomum CBS 122681]